MRFVVTCLLRLDIEDTQGTDPNTGEDKTRKTDAKEPFAALAFKIMTDPFVGRLAFFRVTAVTWMRVPMC